METPRDPRGALRCVALSQEESNIKQERRAYRITGRVQGVGYRYFTRYSAKDLELTGWVSNRADGSVEVHVVGPRPKLEKFEGLLKQGPPSGHVDALERIQDETAEGFQDFEIRFG